MKYFPALLLASLFCVPAAEAMPVTVSGSGVQQPGFFGLLNVIPASPAPVRQPAGGPGTLRIEVRNANLGVKAFAVGLDLTPIGAAVRFAQNFDLVFNVTESELATVLANGHVNFGILVANVRPGTTYNASLSYNAVPEPASMSLLAIGATACGVGIRRRRSNKSAATAA